MQRSKDEKWLATKEQSKSTAGKGNLACCVNTGMEAPCLQWTAKGRCSGYIQKGRQGPDHTAV